MFYSLIDWLQKLVVLCFGKTLSDQFDWIFKEVMTVQLMLSSWTSVMSSIMFQWNTELVGRITKEWDTTLAWQCKDGCGHFFGCDWKPSTSGTPQGSSVAVYKVSRNWQIHCKEIKGNKLVQESGTEMEDDLKKWCRKHERLKGLLLVLFLMILLS